MRLDYEVKPSDQRNIIRCFTSLFLLTQNYKMVKWRLAEPNVYFCGSHQPTLWDYYHWANKIYNNLDGWDCFPG